MLLKIKPRGKGFMKNFWINFLALIFSMAGSAMNNSSCPKLNYVFDYELLNQPKLDVIFEALASELSLLKNDENSIIEFLRRETKDGSIKALALYLRSSEKFMQLSANIRKVTEKVSDTLLEEREIESIAAKILVVVISSDDCLNYFIPILKRYEDYVEISSTKETAYNKAFLFFCFYVLNPIIFDLGKKLKNKNLINLAVYFQKSAPLCAVMNSKSLAGQQVLDTLILLQNKFQRDYYFSVEFCVKLSSGLLQSARKIKPDIIITEKRVVINWLQTTYFLAPQMAHGILSRLVDHKFLLKKAKKIGKSTKYIIQPHSQTT